MNLRVTFRLSTLLLSIALVGISLTMWRRYEEHHWNRMVDQFETFQSKMHKPIEETEIVVRLMRQNPWHSLWKEFEFSPIFSGDKFGGLFTLHISWPQQTIQLGEESVHVLTSQHPCNSRKLVVLTDAANRILDVQTIDGIRNFDTMSLTVLRLSPQPVIRLARIKPYGSNDLRAAYDLTLSKSTASLVDPKTIEIIDRKPAE